MKPTRYRKRPVEVVALKWTGRNWEDMKEFCPVAKFTGQYLVISTGDGRFTADSGSYIVKGEDGEFYPVRGDVFISTYEPV